MPETSNAQLDQDIIYVTTDETPKLAETTELIQKVDSLTEKVKSLEEGQRVLSNIMHSVETNVLKKLAEITATIDAFVKHCASNQIDRGSQEKNKVFVKICNKRALDEFEELLNNPSYKTEIKDQLSVICGKGKGRANNNAYALSDVLFSRDFLTQCSWTGSSRNQEGKLCFKICTNTIQLLFELIHLSDKEYTY